jgi:hypothetical protein
VPGEIQAVTGETRDMFSDLVGSTALSDRAAPQSTQTDDASVILSEIADLILDSHELSQARRDELMQGPC